MCGRLFLSEHDLISYRMTSTLTHTHARTHTLFHDYHMILLSFIHSSIHNGHFSMLGLGDIVSEHYLELVTPCSCYVTDTSWIVVMFRHAL